MLATTVSRRFEMTRALQILTLPRPWRREALWCLDAVVVRMRARSERPAMLIRDTHPMTRTIDNFGSYLATFCTPRRPR